MIFSTESKDWALIHHEKNGIKAELLKNELESQEILCVVINKQDSNYPIFGRYDLYVKAQHANLARVIIDLFLTNNEEEEED